MGREGRKVVVLDDHPTGIQTVHGVFVYTDAGMGEYPGGAAWGGEDVFYIDEFKGSGGGGDGAAA